LFIAKLAVRLNQSSQMDTSMMSMNFWTFEAWKFRWEGHKSLRIH